MGSSARGAGGDLGVKDRGRHDPTRRLEDVEVLFGRVHDGNAWTREDVAQRFGIDGEGIDEDHLIGPSDLDQGQLGVVGALEVELGVDGVILLALKFAAKVFELVGVFDQGWLHPQFPPMSIPIPLRPTSFRA